MDDTLNLEIRSEVLGIALEIEQAINNLLNTFLSVSAEKPKAITNRSSSLTFKNKIDLLFDIGVLDKLQHEGFLLLMEIRNQFMHNSDCSSFTIAVSLLNREKQLLNFVELDMRIRDEDTFRLGYQNLYIQCLDSIIVRYEERRKMISEKKKIVIALAGYASALSRIDERIFKDIVDACTADEDFSKSAIAFKSKICDIIKDGHEALKKDSVLQSYDNEISKIIEDKDYVKKFYS